MHDDQCVNFLQWALPQLGKRWVGFKKVRRQVCKRIQRRLEQLGFSDMSGYKDFLAREPSEWQVLDFLCRVTISRFYRDRFVFDCIKDAVFPRLAIRKTSSRERILRCWSAGCMSGEEAFSLALIWKLEVMHLFPDVSLEIVATDIDEKNISRATTGCFPMSSLREIPTPWLSAAFCQQGDQFCLAPEIMKLVKFYALDIKHSHFDERFDLICCRNLIFTYFDIEMQQEILQRITGLLHPAGFLVIGCHENLPPVTHQFQRSFSNLPIYQKKGAG